MHSSWELLILIAVGTQTMSTLKISRPGRLAFPVIVSFRPVSQVPVGIPLPTIEASESRWYHAGFDEPKDSILKTQ